MTYTPGAARKSQTFTASGTWTRPAGVTSVDLTIVGGGAASASLGQPNGAQNVAAGGAGGGQVRRVTVPVNGNVAVVVGAGGSTASIGGSGSINAGGNGGQSSFGSTTAGGGLGAVTSTTHAAATIPYTGDSSFVQGSAPGLWSVSTTGATQGGGGGGAGGAGRVPSSQALASTTQGYNLDNVTLAISTNNTYFVTPGASMGAQALSAGGAVRAGDGGVGIAGFGGGGGGGSAYVGTAGSTGGIATDGGGNGGAATSGAVGTGTAGTANTGGGGGGSGTSSGVATGVIGAAGGSGIVIVEWWE